MYKHIIWDFDGTLFDTYPVMGRLFKELLAEEGIEEPLDEILKHMKVSMTFAIQYYEEKYHITQKLIDQYHQRRKEREFNLSKPYPGIEEICRFIYESGRRNYLYTHRGSSSIALLKEHGLHDYFSDFITSKQGFARKPSPEAIHYLIDQHNMVHSEAIMIGDRDIDILSAKNASIDACFFTEGGEKSELADYTIHRFDQLSTII